MKKWEFPDGKLYLGDCLKVLPKLPEKSVDLVVGSPPYEAQRLYLEDGEDLGLAMDTEEWCDWMVKIFKACLRVCKGMVVMVVGHGKTESYRWSGAPALLCADLIREGINLRSPMIYRRSGIMGSGGPDDFRKDFEWIIRATHGGRMEWSDSTACGHPPKYSPGGQISHRNKQGKRVNDRVGRRDRRGNRSQEVIIGRSFHPDLQREIKALVESEGITRREACRRLGVKPGHISNVGQNGDNETQQTYIPPEKANPGDVIDCTVGGGLIGSNIAHDNEAPFPHKIPNFFIKSFCKPGGTVLDPFSGSGTTVAEAIKLSRNFIGIDLRPSQIQLTLRRIKQARQRKGFGIV